jgi:hypothetical protein
MYISDTQIRMDYRTGEYGTIDYGKPSFCSDSYLYGKMGFRKFL